MKHSLKITLFLVGLFLATQLIGLTTVNRYIQVEEVITETGEIAQNISHPDTVLGETPQVENKSTSYIYILLGVLLGTALLFVFIKLNIRRVWKYWFLLSVFVTLAVSFGVYLNSYLAVAAALFLGIWKVYRPNIFVHNLTEIFIYTGITILFLPILNMISAVVLLILISVYDMIAVWKSGHMITLAKFQTESKVFAGLFIPYKVAEKMTGKMKEKMKEKIKIAAMPKATAKQQKDIRSLPQPPEKVKNAILGGGDIAFPLLFSSVVMEHLIIDNNIAKTAALGLSGIIAVAATLALFILLAKAREDRFYPAMPFISAGCFVGWGIVWLII